MTLEEVDTSLSNIEYQDTFTKTGQQLILAVRFFLTIVRDDGISLTEVELLLLLSTTGALHVC